MEENLDEYLDNLLKITAELKRILKSTGQLWWNMGDAYASNGAVKTRFWKGDNMGKQDDHYGRARTKKYPSKCLLMQPERLAIRMIDEQGWILRDKNIWAKQIYLKKQNKTIGSVLPSSAKDRFNMSWEYLFFFVKNKKYYSDLDAVRIPNQVVGITDKRPAGIIRQRLYPGSKYNREPNYGGQKFNLRVRDAQRKAGQPQYKASREEIERYKKETGKIKGGRIYKGKFATMGQEAEKYGSPRARNERKTPKSKVTGLDYERIPSIGKNLPTVWQINPQPHNFRKEFGVDTDHFASFPDALPEIPIKFGCPEEGIVLDPFAGSGTSLYMARKLHRKWIGIDLNSDYCEIAKRRVASLNSEQLSLSQYK